jgi:hypothetical protein
MDLGFAKVFCFMGFYVGAWLGRVHTFLFDMVVPSAGRMGEGVVSLGLGSSGGHTQNATSII